jgi:hypothetical protein
MPQAKKVAGDPTVSDPKKSFPLRTKVSVLARAAQIARQERISREDDRISTNFVINLALERYLKAFEKKADGRIAPHEHPDAPSDPQWPLHYEFSRFLRSTKISKDVKSAVLNIIRNELSKGK